MSQSLLHTFFYGPLGLALAVLCASAEESILVDVPTVEPAVASQEEAMPEMGADRLGSILNRYYEEGLGGAENWEKMVSLRLSGRLTIEGGEFEFNASQKKPHYMKIMIYGYQRHMRMGYDGRSAWVIPKRGAAASVMGPAQARRFIHGARFGSYLLYPHAHGKQIEYLDTVPVGGAICHQIRVTLESEYQVDYFIDIRTYLELKVVNTDLRTGAVNSLVYEDYTREFVMPIARKVVSSDNGVWMSTIELDKIKVNSGVMPWMFRMPK